MTPFVGPGVGRRRYARCRSISAIAWVPLMGFAATFAPSRILKAASYQSGGAGMAGTAADVLRFLEAIRMGGSPILKPETVGLMVRDQVGAAAGTLQWGGAYGHSWFIDRGNGLSVVALTNTAFEGMAGVFPTDVRNAVYGWKRR
ncbi:serine hydrolase [Azospirillum brasilense]|uniref:serine hydrolase n=1 Tax=Azospirillum brasilense TaxID=192 RepID=UPI0024955159|nr:serine hydrolase [Azospirillum brasilense]